MTTNPLEGTPIPEIRPFDDLEREYLSRPEYQLKLALSEAIYQYRGFGSYEQQAKIINKIVELSCELGPAAKSLLAPTQEPPTR
jgi:hypothetical protein